MLNVGRLDDLEWVDPESASLLRAKIDATTELFGYPDLVLNATELDELYAGFHVSDREFFKNQVLRVNTAQARPLKRNVN